MIIFGYRSFVKFLAMLTLVCPRCHNPAAHRLQQRSRWFTLFFVPVIPMGFTRFTTCTFCGLTQRVSKEDATAMVAAANPPQQVGAPQPAQLQNGYPQQGGYPPAPQNQYPQQGWDPQQGQYPQQGWGR
ncbi:zinc-ribbon domain-containing protein [Jatrophihabitans endophyticus]|uniref:zinc-ribbon domain-containing protein n=1 Tax=Jatrophihabitans endophyticus TaxID=1206085 RepID=UPI0019ED5649|nr:zinc-ribbon domain-containing protein [Jatrophihabitans endophyticus]MBE7188245.1 zinc-ribbon domain-containing protein [Jatrophihabitans endophyticus]